MMSNDLREEYKAIRKYLKIVKPLDRKHLAFINKLSLPNVLMSAGRDIIYKNVSNTSSPEYIDLYNMLFNISIIATLSDLKTSVMTIHNSIITTSDMSDSSRNILIIKESSNISSMQLIVFLIILLTSDNEEE